MAVTLLVTLQTAVVAIHALRDSKRAFAICTKDSFRIYDIRSKVVYTHSFERQITTMTPRPNQQCVAIGDISGQIFLLYYNDNAKTLHHWHSQSVNAITFTKSGNALLSGGQENVLVSWQLANQTKDFMPRLGAEITAISISPNFEFYATCLSDNSIKLIKTTNKAVSSVTVGLKASYNNPLLYPTTCGLVHDPRSRQLVLAGTPGYIQFYDLNSDEHLKDVKIKYICLTNS